MILCCLILDSFFRLFWFDCLRFEAERFVGCFYFCLRVITFYGLLFGCFVIWVLC